MKNWLTKAQLLISPTALGLYVTAAFAWTTLDYYTALGAASEDVGIINQLLITAHQKSIDFRLKARGERAGTPKIGLLTVDEKAVETVGRWPWPREVTGRAIDNAIKLGAKVLAFDMVFSEPSNQPAAEVYQELSKKTNLPPALRQEFEKAVASRDSDAKLAQVFRRNHEKLVLGAFGGGDISPFQPPEFDYCLDQLFALTPEHGLWVDREQSSLISISSAPEMPQVLADFYKEHLRAIDSAVREGKSHRSSLDAYNLRTEVTEKQLEFCAGFMNPAHDETYSAIAENWDQVAAAIDPELIKKFPTYDAWVKDFKTQIERTSIPQVLDWTMNLATLLPEGESYNTGYFNAQLDPDGTIRRSRLILRTGHSLMPSIALKAFLLANGYGAQVSYRYSGKTMRNDVERLEILNDEGEHLFDVPVDPMGRLAINYAGRQKMFPYVSMADLLSDSDTMTYEIREPNKSGGWSEVTKKAKKAEFLKDMIFIVGATAIGIYDLRVTPFEENFPGAETHVNVLDNLMRRDFLYSNPSEETGMLAAVILIGAILSFALAHLGALPGLSLVTTMFVGIVLLDRFFLFGHGTVVTIVLPLTLILVQFFVLISYKYLTEERRKKELRTTFSKYVSPAIVEEILSDPSKVELGGRKAKVTVFFSDVRGFTTISEKLDPAALSDLLNGYLTPMTDLVFSNRGTLDKYMGDAIMAFFGAPIPHPLHAKDACHCALSQIEKLQILRQGFREKGLPDIDIGIGLNTGEVSVGNMGSETVRSYTVMGDAVNLASRLEGINKEYGTRIIVSEFTRAEIGEDFVCRELDLVRVKGKLKPVKIFELIAAGQMTPGMSEWLKAYNEGFQAYYRRQFNEALTCFQRVLELRPDDGPTLLYVERCQDYLTEPPSPDWDGVFTMKTK